MEFKKAPRLLPFLICTILYFGCAKTSPPNSSPGSLSGQTSMDTAITTDAAFYSVTGNDSSSPRGEILMALNSKTDGKLFFLDQLTHCISFNP